MSDIILKYPHSFPDEIINEDIKNFNFDNLDINIEKPKPQVFAALEWIIPTSFGVYILKPYFDSFLKEAGKDHYNLLKAGIKKIISKGKEFDTKLITARESTKKLNKKYNQSLTVSITIQTKKDINVKLLFDKGLDINDWNNAVEEITEMLLEHYNDFPNDLLSDEINKVNTFDKNRIYCLINPDTKKIEFYDDNSLMELTRNNNS